MKTQLKKVHFEFEQGEDTLTITYKYLGKQEFYNGRLSAKTWGVYYGKNGQVLLSCGRTQQSPNTTGAKWWLKESKRFLKES